MQKPIYILFICLIAFPLSAQNFLLNYSGGRFKEIIPLLTDSVYIVNGTQTRELAFEYDANHRSIQFREIWTEPTQNFKVQSLTDLVYSPNKLIVTDYDVYLLPSPNTSLSRTTTDSLGGKVVSFLGETSNNNIWKATQKDTFIYDASDRLIEKSSQFWDFVDMVWKYANFQRLEYDAQGHISVRRELGVGNSIVDTTFYSEYLYTYAIDGQIMRLISRYGFPPQNYARETYVYDNTGNLDSLQIDYWNLALQIWEDGYVTTLDDSPEQQATIKGRTYRLNNQSQWYLDSDAFYTPGPQIYTDEAAEVLTRKFNVNTNQLQDYERRRTSYSDLPNGVIKGDSQRDIYSNGNWKNEFHAEAWFRKIESVGVKTPETDPAPSCGLPNPLGLVDLPTFLPELGPAQQMEIFSIDGRLVLSQDLSHDFLPKKGMEQASVYWLVLRDETRIICTQKVFLH